MNINMTLREIILIFVAIISTVGGLLYYIYQSDNTVSANTLKGYKIELDSLKVDYKDGIEKIESMRDKDKELFLNKIDSMGRSQAVILEKIYQQSLVSTKAVDEVRVQLAKSSSDNARTSDKIDRVLVRMDNYERKNTDQEKKIIALQRDVTAIGTFLEKQSRNKGFSFFKAEY